MGFDQRIVHKDVVDHAPVVGVERAHFEGLPGSLHPLGDLPDLLGHLVLADGPEMFAIHLDALRFGLVPPQDAVDEILDVVQALAVAADDGLALRRVDLQTRAVVGFLGFDGHRNGEMAEHRVKDSGC